MQHCSSSITNALELLQFCTKPSNCSLQRNVECIWSFLFQVNVILLKVIIFMWPAICLRSINIHQICFVFVLTLKAFRIFQTKFVNRYFNDVWMRYHARIVTFFSYHHQIGNTSHCLKLGYETMVCTLCLAICLAMFFLTFSVLFHKWERHGHKRIIFMLTTLRS